MKVLIEGQSYPAEIAQKIFGKVTSTNTTGDVIFPYVGYFFNKLTSESMICLPKVVMQKSKNEELAFGSIHYLDIIDAFSKNSQRLTEEQQVFIKDFALWSYRTISTYAKLNPDSKVVKRAKPSSLSQHDNSETGTLLDVILAIVKFYNENKDYFMYVIKNLHSGYNRVNWGKTVTKKTPVLKNGTPIYLDVVNKKKQIDFDEELMLIFYSILNYINSNYGFDLRIECNYDLITGNEFELYKEEVGLIRLRTIKYKYFSDKDILIWRLCYSFFEKTSKLRSGEKGEDYLFVTNFDRVFESMVNSLISDTNIPQKLIEQKDGKLIDHIFIYKSPIDDTPIYYIGDSKYYKTQQGVHDTSLYKQYTYAKNVIQFHFDKTTKDEDKKVKYRETESEGYSFTPNFFISAIIPNEFSYNEISIDPRKLTRKESMLSHFDNRFFDRDTLWLSHYDINLLYIMSLYARNEPCEQNNFKSYFKQKVYDGFKTMIKSEYSFYTITVPGEVDDFIKNNFFYLNGKIRKHHQHFGKILLVLESKTIDKTIPGENFTLRQFLESKHAKIEDYEI